MPAPTAITVRRATADDLDRVATVWHQSASLMDGAVSPMPSRQQLRDRIDRELAAGWELFLAERGGHIMGMLALRPADAVLDHIFVLPDREGSGIGTALMAMAKRRMPEGFGLRMAAANERAARFYERSGLVLSGVGNHPSSGVPVRYYEWQAGR